jgi:hypothetical protein
MVRVVHPDLPDFATAIQAKAGQGTHALKGNADLAPSPVLCRTARHVRVIGSSPSTPLQHVN